MVSLTLKTSRLELIATVSCDMHTCMCAYMCAHACVWVCMCVCVWVCMWVCACVCVWVWVHEARKAVCVATCIHRFPCNWWERLTHAYSTMSSWILTNTQLHVHTTQRPIQKSHIYPCSCDIHLGRAYMLCIVVFMLSVWVLLLSHQLLLWGHTPDRWPFTQNQITVVD